MRKSALCSRGPLPSLVTACKAVRLTGSTLGFVATDQGSTDSGLRGWRSPSLTRLSTLPCASVSWIGGPAAGVWGSALPLNYTEVQASLSRGCPPLRPAAQALASPFPVTSAHPRRTRTRKGFGGKGGAESGLNGATAHSYLWAVWTGHGVTSPGEWHIVGLAGMFLCPLEQERMA